MEPVPNMPKLEVAMEAPEAAALAGGGTAALMSWQPVPPTDSTPYGLDGVHVARLGVLDRIRPDGREVGPAHQPVLLVLLLRRVVLGKDRVVNLVLKIGLHHRVQDASQPPEDTRSLTIQNCHHVELYGGLLNHMEHLQNLSVSQAHAVVIHPKLFDSRGASEAAGTIQSISLSNIHNLQVRRYSFKDLKVTGIFYLGEVVMDSVVSMAFHFKFVKEFKLSKNLYRATAYESNIYNFTPSTVQQGPGLQLLRCHWSRLHLLHGHQE